MSETPELTPELTPEQHALPLGFVRGEPVLERPEDLYIPPDALELILEAFSGPMDLLLYLIRRHKVEIVDLPILPITQQYMTYVDMMKELKLELAADYLVMAAMLTEIKSRLLLPKPPQVEEEDIDPRAELVRRLREYEAICEGAGHLDAQPQQERDFCVVQTGSDARELVKQLPPEVSLEDLVLAFGKVMQQAQLQEHHHIHRERLSTRARMSAILDLLTQQSRVRFSDVFDTSEGKAGVVVSFLAILELSKEALIEITQVDAFSELHISKRQDQQSTVTEHA